MKFKNVKPGEVLSTTKYVTVVKREADYLKVRDTDGTEFTIHGPEFIEKSVQSGMQYTTEEEVTKTELAEKLLSAGDTVFTVDFIKADGKPRVLTGRLLDTENHMGRSNVIDLMINTGSPTRQVDHRTLKSLILRDVKYTIKK